MSLYNIQIEHTADQEVLSRLHESQCLLASFWTQQTGTEYLTECQDFGLNRRALRVIVSVQHAPYWVMHN